MDLFDKCQEFQLARQLIKAGLYPFFRPIQKPMGGRAVIEGKEKVMAGSNNYLGLTHHPKVKEAAIRAIEKYGTGCSGSRFLNGTIDLHLELEAKLAKFMNKEEALVFSTGFQTNLGAISCLVGENDIVFSDSENHASIIEGIRLTPGKRVIYEHNNMQELRAKLEKYQDAPGKFVVADGVFSMTGELCRLKELVDVSKEYGARIFVDDAHGIGVLGDNGRGVLEHFGVIDDVDLVMGTFSKSFASIGGFVAGSEEVIHFIKHQSRAMIFSAALPPSAIASVIAALEIIETEPEQRDRLWKNTLKVRRGFEAMGLDPSPSETPILPIYVKDTVKTLSLGQAMFEAGVFANPVVNPGVPPGKELIRTSYMAIHTDEELDTVLSVTEKLVKKFELV